MGRSSCIESYVILEICTENILNGIKKLNLYSNGDFDEVVLGNICNKEWCLENKINHNCIDLTNIQDAKVKTYYNVFKIHSPFGNYPCSLLRLG
ncbi:hypothetical protein KAI32_00610 [Candidatus Pacearchaeota archaeon]|nr:hypothetical protein [Candidatus Pacearchaeota archaeon]